MVKEMPNSLNSTGMEPGDNLKFRDNIIEATELNDIEREVGFQIGDLVSLHGIKKKSDGGGFFHLDERVEKFFYRTFGEKWRDDKYQTGLGHGFKVEGLKRGSEGKICVTLKVNDGIFKDRKFDISVEENGVDSEEGLRLSGGLR